MNEPRTSQADDETLSALIDGALAPSAVAELETRLAREPALAARLAVLERANAAVHAAYHGIADEPVPQKILDLLAAGDASDPRAGARRADGPRVIVDLPKRARGATARRYAPWPLALAASIALTAGIGLGVLMAPAGAPVAGLVAGTGPVEPRTALHKVLERHASGTRSEVSSGLTASPQLSFMTASGDYCRELDLYSDAGTTTSLACRRAGAWRIEIAEFAAESSADGGVYRPAGGAPSHVDDAIDALIADAPLDADSERALIARGWRAE